MKIRDEKECDPQEVADIRQKVDGHDRRIVHLETKLGVNADKDGQPDFITRKEFRDWSEDKLMPRLKGIEDGQSKIMLYITAVGVAGGIILFLLNSGIFKVGGA